MKMNKKGQVADFLGGIQRFFSWLISSAPRPLQLMFFLIILLLFGVVIGWFVNLTGNFCDTNGNEYTTGVANVFTNLNLVFKMPSNDELSSTLYEPDEQVLGIIPKCTKHYSSPFYYDENDTKTYLPTGSGDYYDGSFCTECESETIYSNITFDSGNYCLGDVFRVPREDLSLLKKTFCGGVWQTGCEPPEGFFYDQSINSYTCIDDLCLETENETSTIGKRWNLLLKENGAKIKPESPYGEKDYRNAVGLTCDVNDVQPKIKFYGINIFDYRMWVFLFILATLVWLVFKIKKK